ncbi:hypothetical protein GC089_01770 [Cellulomonas sp. JZ18]|uniref:hypothetical protein n=1 Tax=Cellulomonas sp. JZ18 TaxID=2654191 RepID=UPI0012D3A5C6|nr:hypothetical protein [Cellulomonas sp. JZ18]QGQ18230.1 hypothetical protein GC089_01770 [Cellulomonas sp. JZ18]
MPHVRTRAALVAASAVLLGALVAAPAVGAVAAPAVVPAAARASGGLADPDAPTAVPTHDPALDVDRGGVNAPEAATTTWSLVPASAEGPDGRVSLRHELDPGAQVTEHLALTNHTDAPQTFALAAGDGVVTPAGDFDLPPTGTAPRAAGAWLDVPATVEVGPGATVVVPVTLTVPADARPGDHPAGVVASLATPVGADDARVVLDSRVGVRLHLRVTGDIAAALAVTDVATRYVPSWNPFAPGAVEVSYVLQNTGDVRLGADATVAVDPWLGASASTAGDPVREVLPGGSVARSVVVPGVWPVLRAGVDVSAEPAVVGEDVVPVAPSAAAASASVWTPPYAQAALLLVALALVLGVRTARRRAGARVEQAVARARADALATVGAPVR